MKPVVYVRSISKLSTELDTFLDDMNFDSLFQAGDTVILKPNFVAPRDNIAGATTNLELIELLSRRLCSLGATPIITEVPGMEFNIGEVFGFLGIEALAQRCGAQVFVPGNNDYVHIPIPQGKILHHAWVNRLVPQAKIINIPILKTHVITGITTGMKNLMGLVSNKTRKQMHIKGIHQCVADLASCIEPTLTICDALYSMEGDGAVYGTVLHTNKLFASTNQRALDCVLCDFMGIDWRTIEYIKQSNPPSDIAIDGDFTPMNFKLPQQGAIYRLFYRGMYLVDLFWEKLFGIHFNEYLYKTGRFGTHPFIDANDACKHCRLCMQNCPVQAIREDWSIDPKKCLRCLRCYDNCSEHRIHVKGFSNPEHYNDETKNHT